MDHELYTPASEKPRMGPVRKALLISAAAFLIGLAVMGWAVTRWEPARRLFIGSQAIQPIDVAARLDEASALPPPSAGNSAEAGTASGNRVAALEQKMDEIDQTADAASGNAGRAEGLLIAFAARRAIERGLALGYLEAALQSRFGKTQPRAVGMIINASHRPITLDDLGQGLTAIAPNLVGGGPDEGWWASLKRTMSGLIVVRKTGTPSPAPTERLARAQKLVEAGRVDVALAEVARLPGANAADKWMDDARRYVEAHRALDTLEASSIMLPQNAPRPEVEELPQPAAPVAPPPVDSGVTL